VLLPANRSDRAELADVAEVESAGAVRNRVFAPLPPVSVSPPTAAAETWTESFSNPPVKLSVPAPA
jgi:hypothetical protein